MKDVRYNQGETLGNGVKKNMNPEGVQFADASLVF